MSHYVEDSFLNRFGGPTHLSESFSNTSLTNIFERFNELHSSRQRQKLYRYDTLRQEFLKIIESNLRWDPLNDDPDSGIHLTKLSNRGNQEYIALMRLQPKAYKTDSSVSPDMEILYHCLLGSVVFVYVYKMKPLSIGRYITIKGNTHYSIKCTSYDQPTYLLLRIREKVNKASFV